jgi:hypothetical protein
MFFRAYLTDSEFRQDKAYSHMIYVELIDGGKRNRLFLPAIIPVKKQSAEKFFQQVV